MELEFSDDQEALRDAIRAVLVNEAPIALAREVAEHGSGAERLAAVVAELGWAALTVPEDLGGIGLGAVEAGILAEELGRAVAPGPLLATVTQLVPYLDLTGDDAQRRTWLGAVATGAITGSVGVESTVRATDDGDACVLDGSARFVVEGDVVDVVVLVLADDAGAVVVRRDEVEVEAIESIDPSRRLAHLHCRGARVPADRRLARATPERLATARLHAVCALALEIVGASQSIFDTALDYAKERRQFGVPIGSFQAIKHKFADMAIALERARATGYLAALCLAEDDDRAPIMASVAKAAAGDCQRRLAKEGIQILGGIGYTWEADMHLYVKRVKADEAMFGTAAHHRARIADLLGV